MAASIKYEDFGEPVAQKPPEMAAASREAVEEEKLEAFETGYQAGWDDAVRAQSAMEHKLSSELAAQLQDASFQYHELRNHLTRSLQEMMRAIVDTVLPQAAKQSLGSHICQLVETHVRKGLDGRIELALSEQSVDRVEPLLAHVLDQYNVVVDAALQDDQAIIRVGQTETSLDLNKVVQEISAAVTDFFETQLAEAQDDRSA